MTFQTAPECAEAVVQATFGGKAVNNVFNFWYPGGYDQTKIDNLAVAVDVAVGNTGLICWNNDVLYEGTLARGLQDIIDLTSTATTNSGPGTAGTGIMPANVSFVITLRTGFTGRSARGRVYMLPLDAGAFDNINEVSAAYADLAEDFVEAVVAEAATAGWTLVVLSRISGKAVRPAATHLTVTQVVARNRISDSQRHRLPKGH